MLFTRFQSIKLKASLQKWEDIINGKKPSDRGHHDCPCCFEWHTSYVNPLDITCLGCPISQYTGISYCCNTPYEKWNDHHTEYHKEGYYTFKNEGFKIHTGCKECHKLAIEERDFIKMLYEKSILLRKI